MTRTLFLPLVLIFSLQQQEPEKIVEPKPVSVPAQGVIVAHADAAAISQGQVRNCGAIELPFVRYIFIPDGAIKSPELRERVQAMTMCCAMAGRQAIPMRPDPIAGGRLLRINLRKYFPSESDLKDALEVWESLQFDPKFSLLITKDMIGLLTVGADVLPRPNKVMVVRSDFTREMMTERQAIKAKDILLIRIPAPHVDQEAYAQLMAATNSQAPIVHYGYFLFRALSSIQDDGIYKQVFGGLYYDFSGIRIKGEDKGSDEDKLFQKLGLGNIKAGITAQKLFDTLKSDQRVGVFKRRLNGRPSRIDWFRSPSSRESTGLVFVTHDTKQKSIDIGQHPILNLVDFRDDAREIIFERSDGTHGFALFDSKGKLQDEAPFDVAVDRTVPGPHMPRLQSAIGCIRCHGTEKAAHGWHSLKNDVKLLAAKGLDIFGDINDVNRGIPEVLERLAGWYGGSPDRALRLGRDDYMAAVLRITGPWPTARPVVGPVEPADVDQTDVVYRMSSKVSEIYREYFYDSVSPQRALLELGFDVPEAKAVAYLNELLPMEPGLAVGGILPEDPRIGALKAGLEISRVDWELTFSFASMRSQRTLAQRAKK